MKQPYVERESATTLSNCDYEEIVVELYISGWSRLQQPYTENAREWYCTLQFYCNLICNYNES